MRTFSKASAPAGAKTMDAAWYVDAEVFERERERIFGRSWICIAHVRDLDEPGSFVTATIAGESLIVTRDSTRRVRAFYNVCRHRGTRMCEAERGVFKGSIQCPYHAWTYGLDGTLLAARNMEDTAGFHKSEYPLKEAAAHVFEGFLFVSLEPDRPFDAAFAPLAGRFGAWNAGALQRAARIEYDVRCNWKLVFQNYSECYHCPVIHPQLERLSPSESGRNDLFEGPFLGGYSELREGRTTLANAERTRDALPGVTGADLGRVYYYTIFPSLLLSLHPDYVMAHYVQPLAPDRTRIACEWFFDPQAMNNPEFESASAVEFWDLTNRQDWHVSELTQLGLSSRAYVPGPYSAQEGLLHAFDRHYLQLMS